MENLEHAVADLIRRVEAVEEARASQRWIVGYGLAVDAGDAERGADVFAEDGVYDVDVGRMEGREAIRRMVRGERHQAMVGHCAHQMGPATVTLDGPERATAVGYSRVYLQTPAGTHVYRVSLNRWELGKPNGAGLIRRPTPPHHGQP